MNSRKKILPIFKVGDRVLVEKPFFEVGIIEGPNSFGAYLGSEGKVFYWNVALAGKGTVGYEYTVLKLISRRQVRRSNLA